MYDVPVCIEIKSHNKFMLMKNIKKVCSGVFSPSSLVINVQLQADVIVCCYFICYCIIYAQLKFEAISVNSDLKIYK